MIPYDIDPSLYTAEPETQMLDDGFSPPPHRADPAATAEIEPASSIEVDPDLSGKNTS